MQQVVFRRDYQQGKKILKIKRMTLWGFFFDIS